MEENKLITFIETLTAEQIEKLIKALPRLIASIGELNQPYPQEQNTQGQ